MLRDKERDRIVDDLLRKAPRHEYDAKTLFGLNLHSEIQVQSYLLHRFFDGKSRYSLGRRKATLTRRLTRLWGRLEEPVTNLVRNGGEGIYEITVSWGYLRLGYVYANSTPEAKQLGELFLFPSLNASYHKSSLQVKFCAYGDIILLHSYNSQFVEELRNKIKAEKTRAKEAINRIEEFKTREETILTFHSHQLASEGMELDLNK
tara:strand:+ start:9602 stop:10216 length:615 start_codon:yes stop_codon:yes gene_type:complete